MSEQDAGAVPPSPSDSAGPSRAAPDVRNVQQTVEVAGSMVGENVTVAADATIVSSGATWIKEQYVVQQSKAVVRRFSCGDGLDVDDEEVEGAGWAPVSEGEIETLVTHLAERRVLLLSAERGAGKVSAAIYLGTQLRQTQRCTRLTLVTDSLDRQVRIDVRHLAERDKGLAGRLIIFRKPFGRADPELARLFEKTDRAEWDQLAARLRQQNAYLVFTADPKDAATFRDRAAVQGLLRELPPHPPTRLEQALDEKLQALEGGGAAHEPLRALHAGRGPLLASFHFSSSLAEFVDFYVDHYRPDLGLEDAIARFHDSSEWLLQELERDFEFWSFGFTLALAQCAPDAQGIAWLDFDRLHRRVRQWLRRDLNQRPAAAETVENDDAEIHPALSEEPLLRRCRAEIIKDSSTLGDVVQFRDGAPPGRLWTVILERHRRALTTILPGLRELAENGSDDLHSLRILAAQILGRIGEVDPHRVVLPLLDRWVRSDRGRHHGVVGPLYDGVIGSGSERYLALCLRHLKQLRASGDRGLHAAIGAYSWIGDHDLGLAMRELGEITREHLSPLIGDVQEVGKLLGKLESVMRKQARAGADVDDLLHCHEMLRDLMGLVFEEKGPTLLGVQGSLVSLCLTEGAVPVFREMLKWVAAGGWKTGVLIALMFLHENGIANALNASRVEVSTAADGPPAVCNPLVMWVAAGNDEVRQTARFLGELYESLMTPHGVDARLQNYCRDSLQGHLLDWVRDAAPLPEYAAAMRSLFQAMAATHDGVLRLPLDQLLARREFNNPEEPALRAFAAGLQR
ncbi:MAG TPA: hypothetical protein VGX50_18995 [Longimicrobium sp.]|nr:hypothetical protein [Longimicrobium sp.]